MLRPWPTTGECESSSPTRTRGRSSRGSSRTASARSAPTSRRQLAGRACLGLGRRREPLRLRRLAGQGRAGARRDPRRARPPRDHGDDERRRALARRRGAVGQRAAGRRPGRKRSTEKGYAPWEVRVTCRSRHEAIRLEQQLEAEGYRPIRQWKHLIVGTDTPRGRRRARRARLHGEVEAGGAIVWEEAIDSDARSSLCLLRLSRRAADADDPRRPRSARAAPSRRRSRRSSPGRPPSPGAARRGGLAGADREPAAAIRGAVAAEGAPQLLLDRLGGAREQRRRRAGAARRPTRRCSTTAPAPSIWRGAARPAATAFPT